MINDDDDFETAEYDFDDDEEVADYDFVDDEDDDEDDDKDDYEYDFVDDDGEEYDYEEEDDYDISDYDLADDNLYDYQNWIADGDDDYDNNDEYNDDIGDDDESKALDEILGKLEKYQTAHRTMFIISAAVILTALIWLYLCKCRAKGNAAKTEFPDASQGRADKRKLYGVTVKK